MDSSITAAGRALGAGDRLGALKRVALRDYYNEDRAHMSLDGDAPVARGVERREAGKVVALPRVRGLHHRYIRKAA
jgi:hypothetical protein